jgi:hypothetical protein
VASETAKAGVEIGATHKKYTSNRRQEPDQSGSYVLAMPALQGGFPWTVYTMSVTG